MTKYHAKKTEVHGHKFDSKREAARYCELLLLQKAGKVSGITLQVPFLLAPGIKLFGESRKRPAIRYIADFVYTDVEACKIVVEDVKGMDLPMGRLKRHLMKTIHDIDVLVTT